MSFLQRARVWLVQFMQGRYGPDQLSLCMLWTALLVNILRVFFRRMSILFTGLGALAFVLLVLSFYRIFSRQTVRRGAENRWFLSKTYPLRTKARQAYARFQNRKQYVYFACPGCKCKMRLPRSVHGTVKITCKSCGQAFEKKL